jgi:hypothetical protein
MTPASPSPSGNKKLKRGLTGKYMLKESSKTRKKSGALTTEGTQENLGEVGLKKEKTQSEK